jgi:hypothetical protein
MYLSNRLKSSLGVALACLLLMNCNVLRAAALPEGSGGIVITILEGEGALNDIRQRTAREPIVQVDDENHRPIAGAAVVFLLPNSGPGGSFAGGALKISTTTDKSGHAFAKGLQPNNVAGSFQIQVVVTVAGQTAQAVINQQNAAHAVGETEHNGSAGPHYPGAHVLTLKIILSVGAVAAAGTAVGIIATHSGNSTVISSGQPTVGPPSGGVRIPLRFRSH